jgi:hypothetical protein
MKSLNELLLDKTRGHVIAKDDVEVESPQLRTVASLGNERAQAEFDIRKNGIEVRQVAGFAQLANLPVSIDEEVICDA